MQFRTVHAVAGSVGAALVRQALDPPADEPVLSIDDCLSCGPLREFSTVDEWKTLRREFWRSISYEHGEDPEPPLVPDPMVLASAESIVLWVGTGLAEQIVLTWFPQLLRLLKVPLERVQVAQVPLFAVAICKPGEIRDQTVPKPLGNDDLAQIDRTWLALTAPSPTLLVELLESGASRLSALHHALRAVAVRYPDRRSGLSNWDRLILTNVRDRGPRMVHALAYSLADDFNHSDPVGDHWICWRMQRFADVRFPCPLLRITGDPFKYREATVELTPAGHDVLDGRANALDLNGIDDEVFGVHLDSKRGNVWVEDGGKILQRGSDRT